MRNWKRRRALLVVAAGLMMNGNYAASMAPPTDSPTRSGVDTIGPADHLAIIDRLGLKNLDLNLTRAQRAEIDNIVSAYILGQMELSRRHPKAQGLQNDQETHAAGRAAFDQLTVAVGMVLKSDQLLTWEAARSTRQNQLDAASSGRAPPSGSRDQGKR